MNKNTLTTFISLVICILGYALKQPIILSAGLFALSGAVTNWLAIHMLFEKVPFLYGSGVIPARFGAFKAAIKSLMMTEFFTQENIDQFLQSKTPKKVDLAPIVQQVDLSPAFDSLVNVIMQSSFGSMIGVFGGADALQPLKKPFIEHMSKAIIDLGNDDNVQLAIEQQLTASFNDANIQAKIETIIDQRLNELTPELVKEMVQRLIKEHLGWLVVWGGVFGALIGLIAALIPTAV